MKDFAIYMSYIHLIIGILATGMSIKPSANSEHAHKVALVGFIGAATFKYFST